MRIRFGILDLAAAVTVLVVVVLPGRQQTVSHAYKPEPDNGRERRVHDIAYYQARLAEARRANRPSDGRAAYELAALLTEAGHSDWGVRVAGDAATRGGDAAWLALLAASGTHAERFEIREARHLAEQALAACDNSGDACSADQRVRLHTYFRMLDAGVRSGIDPRRDPRSYQRAVQAALRVIKIKGGGGGGGGDGDGDTSDGEAPNPDEPPSRP